MLLVDDDYILVATLYYIEYTPFLGLNFFQLTVKCESPQAEHIYFHWKNIYSRKGIYLLGKCTKALPKYCKINSKADHELFATVIYWAAFCKFNSLINSAESIKDIRYQ